MTNKYNKQYLNDLIECILEIKKLRNKGLKLLNATNKNLELENEYLKESSDHLLDYEKSLKIEIKNICQNLDSKDKLDLLSKFIWDIKNEQIDSIILNNILNLD